MTDRQPITAIDRLRWELRDADGEARNCHVSREDARYLLEHIQSLAKAERSAGTLRSALDSPRAEIYKAVDCERERQERLLVERNWKWSMATPGIDYFQKIMVLTEELGEVAHAVRVSEGFAVAGNSHDNHGLYAELVQVAACAVAWLEAIHSEAALETRPEETTRWRTHHDL